MAGERVKAHRAGTLNSQTRAFALTTTRTSKETTTTIMSSVQCNQCKRRLYDHTSNYCRCGARVRDDSGDFLFSAVIGAATDSAILGTVLGGSITGAILGDVLFDGDLFD